MSTIYNEIESYAARWLRGLIAAGHIAPGVVDERSISDLQPADVSGPGQRHFFAGIAGWSIALRLAGVSDDADVWTGSCPCQGFSSAGKRRGFADPRHLWPAWFRLIRECRPPVILGEQVASGLGWAWLDLVFTDLEGEGYACAAADLPACSVGAPHRRQRLFFVAYANGQPRGLSVRPSAVGRVNTEVAQAERRGEARRDCACWDPRCSHRAQGISIAAGQRFSDGGVADAFSVKRDRDWLARNRRGEPSDDGEALDLAELARGRAARGMADTYNTRRGSRRLDGAHGRPPLEPARLGDAVRLGDTGSSRSGRDSEAIPGPQAGGGGQRDINRRVADEPVAPGAAHSGWHDCEWIPCSDGVSRPAEPGTHPLAHGVPARVGKLRAYGNAFVPEVAATFIRAALAALGALP